MLMEKSEGAPGISSRNTGGDRNQCATVNRIDYGTTPKEKFLLWEKASRDTIELKRIYVDITGDLIKPVEENAGKVNKNIDISMESLFNRDINRQK